MMHGGTREFNEQFDARRAEIIERFEFYQLEEIFQANEEFAKLRAGDYDPNRKVLIMNPELRRYLREKLTKHQGEVEEGEEPKTQMMVGMIDMDKLSYYNGRYGYKGGDEAIECWLAAVKRAVKNHYQEETRPEIYLFRPYGGRSDELVIVIDTKDQEAARELFDSINKMEKEISLIDPNTGERVYEKVTGTTGSVVATPDKLREEDYDFDNLTNEANNNMFEVKKIKVDREIEVFKTAAGLFPFEKHHLIIRKFSEYFAFRKFAPSQLETFIKLVTSILCPGRAEVTPRINDVLPSKCRGVSNKRCRPSLPCPASPAGVRQAGGRRVFLPRSLEARK